MKFKKLSKTDIDVSLICLGTMTWGEQNSQEEAFSQMNYSVDAGINFFDTAELYAVPPKADTYTKTETMIGNWFQEKKNRDWWNGSIIFIYVVVPIPLIILSGFDIIKISHDFIIIFMTFCFTHALLYLFKRFFNDFF